MMASDSHLLDKPIAPTSQTSVSFDYSGSSQGPNVWQFTQNSFLIHLLLEQNAWKTGASETSPLWERDSLKQLDVIVEAVCC